MSLHIFVIHVEKVKGMFQFLDEVSDCSRSSNSLRDLDVKNEPFAKEKNSSLFANSVMPPKKRAYKPSGSNQDDAPQTKVMKTTQIVEVPEEETLSCVGVKDPSTNSEALSPVGPVATSGKSNALELPKSPPSSE